MANWDITTAGSVLTFNTNYGNYLSALPVDTNHFVVTGLIGNADTAVVFTVNTNTWAVSTNSSITFDGSSTYVPNSSLVQIDTNHFVNFFATTNGGNRGLAQTIVVNTSTWVVTTAGSNFQFYNAIPYAHSSLKIDTNHIVLFYRDTNNGFGYAQSLTINTSTWAVSTSASSFNFAAFNSAYYSVVSVDANHMIMFYGNFGNGLSYAQTFAVNTSTWAVTTSSATLTFETNYAYFNTAYKIDTNHFINFWVTNGYQGYAQVFTVNTSTWAVTTSSSVKLNYDTILSGFDGDTPFRIQQVNANHFIFSWEASSTVAKTQIFEVNTSTWVVTTSAATLTFETQKGFFSATCKVDTNHFVNFWASGTNGINGKAQVFTVTIPTTTSIKTIDGLAYASVKTVDGTAIASVKTFNGLA